VLHKELGRNIAAKNFDFLITVGRNAKLVSAGAIEAGMAEENVFRGYNQEDVAKIIGKAAGTQDVILLKGSRGMKMEEIIKCFTTYCTS